MFTTVKNQLYSTVRDYKSNKAGNFAIMAALGLTVMLGGIGAAIDLSGAASEKTRLQDLTDSAALAAAASGEDDEAKLREIVDDMMSMQGSDHRGFNYDMTITDDVITVSANAQHETAIMGMFGFKTLPVSTQSGVAAPKNTPIHISLVLDTTDSMSGAKLAALQDAAVELVDIVKESKDAGSQMAVVPFGDYVNVGLGNRNAPWMDVPDDYTETPDCYMRRPERSRKNCREEETRRYRDGVPYGHRREVCDIEYEDFEVEFCPAPRDVEWRGCAGSRNAPLNVQPAANQSTEIPGVMNETCGSEVLPLTDDFRDVEDVIDGLGTRGDTYLPTGLLFGWRSLSESAPFAVDAAPNDTKRAMVFMTDGGNTMTQYDRDGNGDDAYHRSIDPDDDRNDDAIERMLAICNGIKADGITIYTIAYSLDASAVGVGPVLQTCASSASTAYSADNAKELEEAFKDIGTSLAAVRLTF